MLLHSTNVLFDNIAHTGLDGRNVGHDAYGARNLGKLKPAGTHSAIMSRSAFTSVLYRLPWR